nr:MAG TPA: hypothetical protein [Caudoviricetes sp.]
MSLRRQFRCKSLIVPFDFHFCNSLAKLKINKV